MKCSRISHSWYAAACCNISNINNSTGPHQASSSEMIPTCRWVGPSLVFDVANDSINFLIQDSELYAEP
jgi:hypothetical protein